MVWVDYCGTFHYWIMNSILIWCPSWIFHWPWFCQNSFDLSLIWSRSFMLNALQAWWILIYGSFTLDLVYFTMKLWYCLDMHLWDLLIFRIHFFIMVAYIFLFVTIKSKWAFQVLIIHWLGSSNPWFRVEVEGGCKEKHWNHWVRQIIQSSSTSEVMH